jgi:hypothetical protein
MSSNPSSASESTPVTPRRTLTDRVKTRVTEARLALDHPARSTSPKPKRPRRKPSSRPASDLPGTSDAERQTRSLRRVYFEMKTTYQRYRRETGRPALPELREAVQAFKRGPSLTSLVGVATFLDDRGLLGW